MLKNIYEFGKPYDLGYSLAAIAWKESNVGKFMINLQDPSCGFFHNNINTVMSRRGITDTPFNRNVLCQKLINDVPYSASEAVAELAYWRTVHKTNYTKIWASYNAGWSYTNGLNYSQDIKNRIKVLKVNNIK